MSEEPETAAERLIRYVQERRLCPRGADVLAALDVDEWPTERDYVDWRSYVPRYAREAWGVLSIDAKLVSLIEANKSMERHNARSD